METNPEFYLEFARVTGCTSPSRGEENDPISHVNPNELDSIDPSQFVRLSPRFFGPPERPSWGTVKSHCLSIYQSECFYRCISEEQWLRTVVTCNASDGEFSVHSIHSNVMPKQAYLTWFEGIKGTCPERQCSLGYFPARDLLREMMKSNTSPGLCCLNCTLEKQLGRQLVAAERVRFWYLEEADVGVVDDRTEARKGSGGEVRKILWRHGTFARKRFKCGIPNKKFEREFDVALKVSHPNIVHSFGWSDGSFDCSLFMELLEVDLGRFLQESGRAGMNAPFSFQETLCVLLQVAEAVKHLHEEGFVHGDLKPENLLMSELAMPPSVEKFYLVKVADFDCTQRVDSRGAPFSYKIGTKFYIAPEVWRCRRDGGSVPRECLYKIDVYNFGVVSYQVVTGVVYQDFRPDFIRDDVMRPDEDREQWRPNREFDFDTLGDDRLNPLIKRCWASLPDDRPTFEEICRELRELYHQFFPEQVRRSDKSSLADIIVRKRSSKVPTFQPTS